MKQILYPDQPKLIRIDPKIYVDERGYFSETFHAERYKNILNLSTHFVQDNISVSKKNVLRGLHYQLKNPQAKLVTTLQGKIFDVVVDIRHGSSNFGKWYSFELDGSMLQQLFIPAGFAHGFMTLSDHAVFGYKCTDYYDPADEHGIFWQDPSLKIGWPYLKELIISEKDKKLPFLADIPNEKLPQLN